jgi:glycosyltransferase involved in cell wall biosynthesis
LTGIPFSFTARARDIFTLDRALVDKVRDAAFIRSETRYNITYLHEVCSADTSKIHLTYNGLPLKEHPEADVVMKPPIRLSAMGRFVRKKGYDYLLEGMRIIKDSGLAFRLTLAGDGPALGRLQRLVRVLGLWDRVSFPGFLPYDRVSELFRSTDIFLMPSVVHPSGDRDGIPTVILEALAHRVPVIASDVSGISEVVEDRITGLLIGQKDPQSIAAAVWELAHDRQKAVEMAEQGRSRVLRQFDPETNHRRVLELYRQCLVRGDAGFRTTLRGGTTPNCAKLGPSSFNANPVQ